MSCNLKLDIPINLVDNVLKELARTYEISGVIHCNSDDKILTLSKNKGNEESVSTPNHVINFHTHPISAYKNGKTVWGWPSGEDIRESIKFGLSGNKAHIVFSVEGLYIIQVNSCILKKLKELLNSEERGIIIFIIEEYFKCTHNFRCVDEVTKLTNKGVVISPYSYVELVNNFNLSKLIRPVNQNVIRSNSIPDIGFAEINGNKMSNLSLNQFIKQYSDINDIRLIDSKGKEEVSKKLKTSNNLYTTINKIFKKLENVDCKNTWNNKPNSWFYINFFPSVYYMNQKFLQNNKYKSPQLNDIKYLNIASNTGMDIPYIKIFSNKSEGCSIHQISRINKFSTFTSASNTSGTSGTFTTTFGNRNLTKKQNYVLFYIRYIFPYDSKKELIRKSNEFIQTHKLNIDYITSL